MSGKNVGEIRKDSGSSSEVFYEQLQTEYNKLLKRYAEAENTIDELRTGAKIRLYSDSQDGQRPVSRCSPEPTLRYSQKVNFPRALHATVSSTGHDTTTGMMTAGDDDLSSFDRKYSSCKHGNSEELPVNKAKQNDFIQRRVQLLKDNVDSLESCLAENNNHPGTLDEISKISQQLRHDHGELCNEVNNYSRPVTLSGENLNRSFSKNELGKELHRMDLRLQDIQQDVNGKLKTSKTGPKTEKISDNSQIKQNSQENSPIDPGLAHLITKLKDLKDTSRSRAHDDGMRLSRSHNSGLNVSGSHRHTRQVNHSSSEGDDVVDARFLTPSPVHIDYDNDLLPRPRIDVSNSDDQFTFETSSRHGPTRPHITNHGGPSHVNYHHDTRGTTHDPTPSSQCYRKKPISAYDMKPHSKEENLSDRCSSSGNHRSHGNQPHDVTDTSPYKYDPSGAKAVGNIDQDNRVHNDNSLSDIADSSRMSTPLFHPRGSTRVDVDNTRVLPAHKQRRMKYKQAGRASNGFDSGFVGSEESRSSRMTGVESPQMMHKLHLSNQWDSSLRLDLSEIDENDSMSSHDQLPRTHEAERKSSVRSPSSANSSPRANTTADTTVLNTSYSPPSSPDRLDKSARHDRYKQSRGFTNQPSHSSVPIPRMQLSDPPLSRMSERQPSAGRSSQGQRTSLTNWDNVVTQDGHSKTVSTEFNPREDRRHKPGRSRGSVGEKKRDSLTRDTVAELRHDITGLRHQLEDVVDQSRIARDVYDDFRREDEDVRHMLSREHERKFDELRRSIEQLRAELRVRTKHGGYQQRTASKSDDNDADVRNEIKKLYEGLQDLSDLRRSLYRDSPSPPGGPSVPPGVFSVDHCSNLAQRVDTIRSHVDHLRSRMEKDTKHDVNRLRCPLCDDVTTHDHIDQRLKSTPVTSHHYHSPRLSATKKTQTFPNLSWSYPGVHASQSPVVHHVHTYHGTPTVKSENDTDSSSEEISKPRRNKRSSRSRRQLYQRHQMRRRPKERDESSEVLDEARHAAKDVQRLSKTILNKISLDLASFKT